MSLPHPTCDAPPALPVDAPIHPLAAALLVFVDNLWMLAEWNAVMWFLTIPLSFLSVFVPTLFLQRCLHRDGWGKALGKGLLLGVLAGAPTSVTGTPVGIALLTWAGIMRGKGTASQPMLSESRAVIASASPPIPVEGQVIRPTPPPVPVSPTIVANAILSPPPSAQPARLEPWWVKLAIVLLLCGTVLLATKMVLDRFAGMAGKFSQQHITETFLSVLPTLARTAGGTLELASATSVETFRREDEKTVAWDLIYLGKTISEISVPVTYRYHVVLRDPWRLEISGSTCVVHAPAIRPTLPPAIHTDKMLKRSDAGWARFDAREQMAELERSLTPRLARTAGDPRRLALAREECRKTVAEFVRDWLLREDHWRKDRFTAIEVVFADEPGTRTPPPATLRLP